MPGVNGIPNSPSFLGPQITAGGEGPRYDKGQDDGLAVDSYSGNTEAWRNRTTTAFQQPACRCGNCPACAAQAYASQGQSLKAEGQEDSGESPLAPGQEEGGQRQEQAAASEPKGVDGEVLTEQEQNKLADLKKTDRAVRAHEQAHVAAAGSLVRRGVSLSYQKGPDGRRYAVAGEVSIDTSKEADPADTISKMRTVRAAALAPVEPSPQDRKVAAAATVTMTNAMSELQLARSAEEKGEAIVAQAAEDMAGPAGDGGQATQEGTAAALGPENNPLPPRRHNAIQRYTASPSAPASGSLTTIA